METIIVATTAFIDWYSFERKLEHSMKKEES